MTKKAVKAEVNTFVKGFVTEASPLNFPENASLDEENFELLKTGVRQRRLGLDYEDGFVKQEVLSSIYDIDNVNVRSYVWEDAGGVSGNNVAVIQIDKNLLFYKMDTDNISSKPPTFIFEMSSGERASFTTVDNKLVIANGGYAITVLQWYVASDGCSPFLTALKTRDIWGLSYPASDNEQYYRPPQSAPNTHIYNLYNQGWGIPRRREGAAEGVLTDPVGDFSSYNLVLPAKEESMWTAMSMMASGSNPYEYLRINAWGELLGSTAPPSKGYFIIDLLKRGVSRVQAVENNKAKFPVMYLGTLETGSDITPGGATVVHEYAGRVFFGGFSGEVIDGDVKSPSLASYVAFSQLVNNTEDISKCYQEGDPTSRENNDIIDTDGGLIKISGINKVIDMQDIGAALIVIGDNGVWTITGGSDYGFSATNYKVSNITEQGCVSPDSVIKVGNSVVYWSDNSIVSIGFNQTGDIVATSLTDESIQSFYNDIPIYSKEKSFGTYDEVSKTLRWMFKEDSGDVIELVLDSRLPAFYKYRIKNLTGTSIRGMFTTGVYDSTSESSSVMAGSDLAVVGTDAVVVPLTTRTPSKGSIRYVMLSKTTNHMLAFGYYKNGSFLDWEAENSVGIDAKGFMLTGAITAGDSSVDKQVPYVTVHMIRTENGVDSEYVPINQSGCLMRSQWEWSNSIASKKWGPSQQVYRYKRGFLVDDLNSDYDSGFEMITTKNKLRGQGRAVSLYFETEPLKDCRIVGWNININGNSIT